MMVNYFYKLIGKEINKKVIKEFIILLDKIHRAIKEAKGIKFISSSLLLIYDAFKEAMQETVIKLIDFENAEETDKEDGDALEGIYNLRKMLEEINEIN